MVVLQCDVPTKTVYLVDQSEVCKSSTTSMDVINPNTNMNLGISEDFDSMVEECLIDVDEDDVDSQTTELKCVKEDEGAESDDCFLNQYPWI